MITHLHIANAARRFSCSPSSAAAHTPMCAGTRLSRWSHGLGAHKSCARGTYRFTPRTTGWRPACSVIDRVETLGGLHADGLELTPGEVDPFLESDLEMWRATDQMAGGRVP